MATIISPRIKINAAQLKAEFARFSAVEKKQILDTTLRNDVKGFVRDVIAITPPGSGKYPLAAGDAGSAAVKHHKIVIYRDLTRIFNVVPDSLIAHAIELGRWAHEDRVVLYRKKGGQVYGVDRVLFKPDLNQGGFFDHHQKHRLKNGRVQNVKYVGWGEENTIGKWKFTDLLTVRESSFKEYCEYVYTKSGILAGGWAAAAKEFKVRMPAIMKRHATGSVQVTIKDDHWHMRTENTVGYATEADMNRRVEFALDSRKRSARIANSIKHQIIAKLKQRGVTS